LVLAFIVWHLDRSRNPADALPEYCRPPVQITAPARYLETSSAGRL